MVFSHLEIFSPIYRIPGGNFFLISPVYLQVIGGVLLFLVFTLFHDILNLYAKFKDQQKFVFNMFTHYSTVLVIQYDKFSETNSAVTSKNISE